MTQRFGDEWVIDEAPDFNQRVEKLFSLREWDSLSHGLVWALMRDPTEDALQLGGHGQLVKKLTSEPSISVYYTVNYESQVVELLDIRRRDTP